MWYVITVIGFLIADFILVHSFLPNAGNDDFNQWCLMWFDALLFLMIIFAVPPKTMRDPLS